MILSAIVSNVAFFQQNTGRKFILLSFVLLGLASLFFLGAGFGALLDYMNGNQPKQDVDVNDVLTGNSILGNYQ